MISWSLLPSGGLCETWFITFSSFVNIRSKRLLCCPSLWRVELDTFCVKKQFKVVLIKARDFGSLQSPRLQFMLGQLKSPTIHLYLAGNKLALHTS